MLDKFNKLIVILSIFVILGVWQVISMTDLPFIPSPGEAFQLFFSGEFWSDVLPAFWATLLRVIVAFFGSVLVGVPLGLLMGYFFFVYKFLEFPVDFFRALPATALFPLFMLFFGVGGFTKIILIIFSCSLVMMVHAASGVKQGSKLRRMAAKTMGASQPQIFTKIVFFDALPQIFTGLKIVLSTTIIIVVVLEMFIGTRTGLGKKLYDFHLTYRIASMYAVIILIGLISYLLNKACITFEKKIAHWPGR